MGSIVILLIRYLFYIVLLYIVFVDVLLFLCVLFQTHIFCQNLRCKCCNNSTGTHAAFNNY